ncbi:unnamed protein product [Linum trigynum]|uniref:Uncharacterized protein n=1 Tax=Linum trigynum TaxID=586398 RepID=A0AAV2E6S5_9ROSI
MEAGKRIKKEQEAACARSVDIDLSHDSSSSIRSEEVVVAANVNDEKEDATTNMSTSRVEEEVEEKAKEEVLVDGLVIATCGEIAKALMPSQEKPKLKIEDEEKVLPIINMIMDCDHNKAFHANQGMETKENYL